MILLKILSNKKMDKENKLILYKDEEGRVSLNTRFADEDVWLTQAQLAEIYDTTQQNISLHLQGIYGDKELEKNRESAEIIPQLPILFFANKAC